MTERINQNQRSGDVSTNIQAKSVSITGISFADARQIAIDAMRSELGVLSQAAEQAAFQRINAYAEGLLSRLQKRPELLDRFQEPRTQLSVKDAHRLHAKRGSDDVADLTLDMLVEFIACRGNDFKSVVLDDAIKATHSLTRDQIDSLTVLLIIRKFPIQANSIKDWCDEMALLVMPFLDGATRSEAQLDYLASTGCTTLDVINQTFATYFNMRYRDLSVALETQEQEPSTPDLGSEFANNQTAKSLRKKAPKEALEKYFSSSRPEIRSLQDYFDKTILCKKNLRVIGSAIAAANLRLRHPELNFDDSLWFAT